MARNIVKELIKCTRSYSSVTSAFENRNPRNLERLRIARKPDGYHLEKPGRCFWYKLELQTNKRKIVSQVVHHINGPVVEASTSEWAIRKQLYSPTDTSAYINLARIFAQRCLEAGLTEMKCDIKPAKGSKMEKFLDEVVKSGLLLKEPDRYKLHYPWSDDRPEKPWEIHE